MTAANDNPDGLTERVAAAVRAYNDARLSRWPRQMRAETAALYVDEVSVEAFRHAVGLLYPRARDVPGKGQRWLIEELDAALDRIHGLTDEKPVPLRELVGQTRR
jgi:hypothetical protein